MLPEFCEPKECPLFLGPRKKNAYLGKLPSNCFPYGKERGHLHKKTFQLEACKDTSGSWFCDQSSKENSCLVLLPLGGLSVLSPPSVGRRCGHTRCTSALQQTGAAAPVSDCAHSGPRDPFLILFSHHLFLTLRASQRQRLQLLTFGIMSLALQISCQKWQSVALQYSISLSRYLHTAPPHNY